MRYVSRFVCFLAFASMSQIAFADSVINIDAAKYYKPTRYVDGEYKPQAPVEAVIPESVPVVSGDSGKKFLVLRFDSTECVFKGNASKPVTAPPRSGAGSKISSLTYDYFVCVPSLPELISRFRAKKSLIPRPGDLINVSKRIYLRVLDGDSKQPTQVRASISIKGNDIPKKLLSISAPIAGSGTASEPIFAVQGSVDADVVQPKVIISRQPKAYDDEPDSQAILSQDRSFESNVSLLSGANKFSVSLFDGEALRESISIEVRYIPQGDSVSLVSAVSGSNIEVVNAELGTYGAKWSIPPGAASRDFYASIHDDREHWVALPQSVQAVGKGATFFPISEEFSLSTVFTLPVDSARLPLGVVMADVEIYALDSDVLSGRSFWKSVPVSSFSERSVSHSGREVSFYALVPVVRIRPAVGELKIFSDAPGTAVYLDGINIPGAPPFTIKDVSPGSHRIKAYAPGYNEILRTVEVSGAGDIVDLELVPSNGNLPTVSIDESIIDQMIVDQNIATIPGNVSNFLSDQATDGFLVISHNGIDSFVQVDSGGWFAHVVALDRGENHISFRYTSLGGLTGVSRLVNVVNRPVDFSEASIARTASFARSEIVHPIPPTKEALLQRKSKLNKAKSVLSQAATDVVARAAGDTGSGKDIRIVLTWDTPTDVDLRVKDPFGNETSYENQTGIPNSLLDVDDTDGFGPEVFTLPNAPAGDYFVVGHHYYDGGFGISSTATIRVDLDGKNVFAGSARLFNDQYWNAFKIEVRETTIRIIGVELPRSFDSSRNTCMQYFLPLGQCSQYAFTTAAGENLVKVRAEASSDIDPNLIRYRVTNLTDQSPVVASGSGTTLSFPASSRGITSLTSPPLSRPLVYKVNAYTDSGLESEPIYIAQDVRSQIRQEFVDKRRLLGQSFKRETPLYFTIGDGSFYGPSFLTSPFVGAEHHFASHGLTVVRQSRVYYDRLNAAGVPSRLTSHWRNPRYNDSLGSSNDASWNSFHQSGDAIDVNPYRERSKWPSGAKTYEEARLKIYTQASTKLPGASVIFHGVGANLHVHIEPK